MKAITILQPWATLIANGAKHIETRSWATKYRGPLAIHAGLKKPDFALCQSHPFWPDLMGFLEGDKKTGKMWYEFPLGSVIAVADLIDCQEMTMDKIVVWRDVYGKDEIAFGDFQPGRYAWILDNVRKIAPIQVKGRQRLWGMEAESMKPNRQEWSRPRGYDIEEISRDDALKLIDNYQSIPPSEHLYYYKYADDCYIGIDNTTGNCWTEEFQTLSQCRRWLRGEIELG